MSLITRIVSVVGSTSRAKLVPDSAGVNGAAERALGIPSDGSKT